jgi:hypothetical protein
MPDIPEPPLITRARDRMARVCVCPAPVDLGDGRWQQTWLETCPKHAEAIAILKARLTDDLSIEQADVDNALRPTPLGGLQPHPSTHPPIPPRTLVLAADQRRFVDWCRRKGYSPNDPRVVRVRSIQDVLGTDHTWTCVKLEGWYNTVTVAEADAIEQMLTANGVPVSYR